MILAPGRTAVGRMEQETGVSMRPTTEETPKVAMRADSWKFDPRGVTSVSTA